jgi:hypothetical protein
VVFSPKGITGSHQSSLRGDLEFEQMIPQSGNHRPETPEFPVTSCELETLFVTGFNVTKRALGLCSCGFSHFCLLSWFNYWRMDSLLSATLFSTFKYVIDD